MIAIDNRGHGASAKLYDPAAYAAPAMAEDARALLDHLGIARADVMGYSMGARITAFLAMAHPDRVRSRRYSAASASTWCGRWPAPARSPPRSRPPRIDDVVNADGAHVPRLRRADAQRSQGAGCLHPLARATRSRPEALAQLRCPVLVAVGSDDVIGGSAVDLAALIPGAEALVIDGRDHMKAVGDRQYKDGVLAFLARRP